MHWTVHDVASQLLDVSSFRDLCVSVLHKCLLDDGRFEAGQFGRKQHSSASAGAVLNGVASLPHVPDHLREHTQALGYALIGDDGHLRGHDEDPGDGTTSWSLSQVLYGVAKGHSSHDIESPKYAAALFRLLTLQNRVDGSWSLRHGDFVDPSLAFYPALLFERLIRQRSSYAETVREPLSQTAAYFLDVAASTATPDINAVLAMSALDRVAALAGINEKTLARYRQRRAELISELVDEHGDLRLGDMHISNELQPRWHSVTWAAILYACTRHWGGIQSSHNLHLSARLLQAFDSAEGGWCGPSRAERTARSWASSLALLNVHLLAQDICAGGLEVNEYQGLIRNMKDRKRFDVVISFGGPDRQVAEQIRNHLVAGGLRVFFDTDFRHNLLGAGGRAGPQPHHRVPFCGHRFAHRIRRNSQAKGSRQRSHATIVNDDGRARLRWEMCPIRGAGRRGSKTYTIWLWKCRMSPSSTGLGKIRSTRWAGSRSSSSATRARTRSTRRPGSATKM
ncbi:hypothetical protein Rhe02_96490 [Rhizocola hellebori]|uniref:Uncharacterized protein n=1 Tax=Rhizocola hellebori TaxID=1392758 RepID=A0A8J3QK64_9ACTN|nr:toll/interleukin-1 receptor domain-containing protein [Rhizocola hellebori]GIH11582.1 hypothetical protein Rhe02_96490 [Rhizocola hellebori]